MSPTTSYDQVIYRTLPRRETHPSHLAATALLFGITGAPVSRCSVLELGCGTGGNIIPIAAEYPESSFIGIDLSPVQINEGNKVISDLGLKNIELRAESIQDLRKGKRTFDYIICHGVFSWVNRNVQNQILKIISEQLSEIGIAYLSYNTLPGWKTQSAVREMMQYHTAAIEEPTEKVEQARALLQFLSQCKTDSDGHYAKLIEESFKELKKAPDHYLFHEYLEENNEAFYFHQIAERLDKQGLTYIADSHLALMGTADISADAQNVLQELNSDRIRYEQYLDFLRNRKLRESLICRKTRIPHYPPQPSAIEKLFCSSPIRSRSAILNSNTHQQEVFSHQNGGEIRTDSPVVKAVLISLAEAWPESRAFSEIFADACNSVGIEAQSDEGNGAKDEIVKSFYDYTHANLLELSHSPALCTLLTEEPPLASALARYQAARQEHVTSLRHKAVKLESIARQVLALLDGARSLEELKLELTALHKKGELVIDSQHTSVDEAFLNKTFDQLIPQILDLLSKQGFLKRAPLKVLDR